MCNQCTRHFANKNNSAFILMDIDCDLVFCGAKCMVRYLMSAEKSAACVQCSTTGNYFTMVRSAQNMVRRAWCSLKCAVNEHSFKVTEEQMIDLTLDNESFFGKTTTGLFEDFFNDISEQILKMILFFD